MTAETQWGNGVEILSTHLSASKYSINILDDERLCNVTPSKANRIVPKCSEIEEKKAWVEDNVKSNKTSWSCNADKLQEYDTLLESGGSPVIKKNARSRKEEIWKYLPKFLIIIGVIQVCLLIWDKVIRKWLVYSPSQRHQVWRFVTYAFIHSDVMHLMLNVVLQILIGAALELEQGSLRTAMVYIGGCVAGAMGSSILEPMLYICGSSGGVYSMLMSHLPHVWLNRRSLYFKKYRLALVGLLVTSDAAYTITHWLIYTNRNPKISLPAHGVGAISGVILGIIVYKGSDQGDVYSKTATVLSTVILFIFILLTILINMQYIQYFNKH